MFRHGKKRKLETKTRSENISPARYGSSTLSAIFPKAERFKPLKRVKTPDFLNPISTLSKRTCTFGFGTRYEFKSLTGRDSPSPVSYTLPDCFSQEKGGPKMQSNPTIRRTPRAELPGPGAYNPHSPLGKNSKKFSFQSRKIVEIRSDSPPPNTYNPCFDLVTKGNFKEICFSKEEKIKPLIKNNSPGPGSYDLPSIFHGNTYRAYIVVENIKSRLKK
ncbi:hypothetical protein SteCoe_12713 [Stentor coeruleus]|uniref:Uncharacterized protein n=1 Tax=Stentor coeruleus TaxID=5963 RepID=A0A1R2CA49_9CILI|nr:hypothetical protein SteCoe_12713 [Stentor coeruleus]